MAPANNLQQVTFPESWPDSVHTSPDLRFLQEVGVQERDVFHTRREPAYTDGCLFGQGEGYRLRRVRRLNRQHSLARIILYSAFLIEHWESLYA